jgi:hypothetical protein
MAVKFDAVFARELEAINFRREAVQSGTVAGARRSAYKGRAAPVEAAGAAYYRHPRSMAKLVPPTHEDAGTCRVSSDSTLTGLSFSGGGVRAASFSLGVMQGLSSVTKPGEPNMLDSIDYLSTVSGGGYIGASLINGLAQADYTFPFESRLDEQETPEVKHLRDHSNFLIPNGAMDLLIGFALVLRGLLVNFALALPFLLFLAILTLSFNPTIKSLLDPDLLGFSIPGLPGLGVYTFTLYLALAVVAALLVSAILTSIRYATSTLKFRERWGKVLALLLIAVAIVAVFETQPFVLSGMASAAGAESSASFEELPTDIQSLFEAAYGVLPVLATTLAPLAALLVAISQKLANVGKTALGEEGWQAILAKFTTRAALLAAAVIVPLLLWIVYIYLSFWGLRDNPTDHCGRFAPEWLDAITFCDGSGLFYLDVGIGPVGTMYIVYGAVILAVILLIGPNANSLHRLYRDRLSRAFLFDRDGLRGGEPSAKNDTRQFSSLKPFNEKNEFQPEATYSPYLLVNTTINLKGSKELNKRGRNSDTFVFSPLFIGSSATGYVHTREMEDLEPDMTLASAMAISGAAASANMGRLTIGVLVFSLAVLNIRLGYWLANPSKLDRVKKHFRTRWWSKIGLPFFIAEAFGMTNENGTNVYLTDGGHIENLGIYELLRRRCEVIVAVDSDMDPSLIFPSLIGLQMMARIDLGVRIELPLVPLQKSAQAITSASLRGDAEETGGCGPHATIGLIRYDNEETGVLIWLKTCLSGDENDYVLDYKRRHEPFPHETTVDQFFSEEQFEVYRSLGFHAARRLFNGDDAFATFATPPIKDWDKKVAKALTLLNVPKEAADKILARLIREPAETAAAPEAEVEPKPKPEPDREPLPEPVE